MELKHLSRTEADTIRGFAKDRRITQRHLPFGPGASIFWDSMGVWRDPKTDQFYPGSVEAIQAFSPTLRRNGLMFGVATNGPALEGAEILRVLDYPVPAAVAVTEGGGIAILASPDGKYFDPKMLASPEQVGKLAVLEAVAKRDPLMRALLEDERTDEAPPIRTPYGYQNSAEPTRSLGATNIVLTLPPQFEILERRLRDARVDLSEVIPGFNPSDYVATVLGYAQNHYETILRDNPDLGLDGALAILTKAQNRRTYAGPTKTGLSGAELNKAGGAADSSLSETRVGGVAILRDFPEYHPEDSIYIADKALIENGINPSERNMIVHRKHFHAGPHRFVNVLHTEPVYTGPNNDLMPGTVYAEVSCRLAVDVTLDDSPPTLVEVERIPFLRVSSGAKAAEALTLLYEAAYGEAA